MEKAFKYRMYPNREQKNIAGQDFFGRTRFVYNHYLAKRRDAYEKMESHSTIRHVLRI